MSATQDFNWIIGPAGRCVSLIAEETRVASLIQRALTALSNQGPLLELAREKLRSANASEEGIAYLQAEQHTLGQWAKDIINDDYDMINRHGVIGMWVAVEVAVEDTALLVLRNDSNALTRIAAAEVKLPSRLASPLSDYDAARIYKSLERHARESRSVADSYCYLLSLLDVQVTLPTDCASILGELNFVRNCLLHRSGIADDRVTTEAPGLLLKPGDQIHIGSERYLRYFDAVAEFARAMLQGTLNSPHIRTM